MEVLRGRTDPNYGSPYENYVAQELLAHGHRLCLYHHFKRGEVDFVVEDQRRGTISLVEVKSGKTYRRHVALDNLLRVADVEIERAYVLRNGNVDERGSRLYLPVYVAGWL